jgi:hypothetical protein
VGSQPTAFAALFGLGTLDAMTGYVAEVRGYKRFIPLTLRLVFPTLHQETTFISVVILFAFLQLIQIGTTSLIILTSAVSGSPHGLASPLSCHTEPVDGTLLGYQLTQALLTDVMVSSVYFRLPFTFNHSL